MKHFKNGKTQIAISEPGIEPVQFADYKELIQWCLDNPPASGFGKKEIRERDRIEVAMKNANGTIKLEDSDYNVLISCVDAMRWKTRKFGIMEFLDAVENAETPKAKK